MRFAYTFKRGDDFKKVFAKSSEEAQKKAGYSYNLVTITKPTGYHALNVNERINAKGNAGLLYTTYKPPFFAFTERPAEARLILKRISQRDPKLFTTAMLLNKNTVSI